MFETLTSTVGAASSFGNITSTIATTAAAFVLEYNATDYANTSESQTDETPRQVYGECDPFDPEFNCTVEEYLNQQLGAQRMPLETAIWVSWKF
jgi:hypothetical protein